MMTVDCAYCNHEITTMHVPAVSDDDAWEQIASEHADDCEWIATRAHRLDIPNAKLIDAWDELCDAARQHRDIDD